MTKQGDQDPRKSIGTATKNDQSNKDQGINTKGNEGAKKATDQIVNDADNTDRLQHKKNRICSDSDEESTKNLKQRKRKYRRADIQQDHLHLFLIYLCHGNNNSELYKHILSS